jgi:hypothetical protein
MRCARRLQKWRAITVLRIGQMDNCPNQQPIVSVRICPRAIARERVKGGLMKLSNAALFGSLVAAINAGAALGGDAIAAPSAQPATSVEG